MKFPGEEVIKAYKNALDGNVTYNAANVPVYTWTPTDEQAPYIYISDFTDFTDTEGTCKDSWGHNTTTLIEIVTRFDGDSGSQLPLNQIADAVIRIIGEGITIAQDFQDVIPNIDSYTVLTDDQRTQLTIKGLLRMRNEIKEL